MPICNVWALEGDALLAALSVHLGELCGNGEAVHLLNRWEATVFYVDELWAKVNSGGFDSYVCDRGVHFERAYQSCETIMADRVVTILDSVRRKFFENRISSDTMNCGMDFESEDTMFYAVGEKELSERLLAYIKENQPYFR